MKNLILIIILFVSLNIDAAAIYIDTIGKFSERHNFKILFKENVEYALKLQFNGNNEPAPMAIIPIIYNNEAGENEVIVRIKTKILGEDKFIQLNVENNEQKQNISFQIPSYIEASNLTLPSPSFSPSYSLDKGESLILASIFVAVDKFNFSSVYRVLDDGQMILIATEKTKDAGSAGVQNTENVNVLPSKNRKRIVKAPLYIISLIPFKKESISN
jgi:hypothetical protein